MKRNKQHEIDAKARGIFQYILPPYLVYREQPSQDYGIDSEIELFQDGHSTGVIFKVQLKGTEKPRKNLHGKQISFGGFPLFKADYLIEQVEIPAILVLVDVVKEIVYWSDIQSNQTMIKNYEAAKRANQESFTIYFNSKNILTRDKAPTFIPLFQAVSKSGDYLALRRAAKIKPPIYAEHISELDDLDLELSHLNSKIDISNSEKLHRLIQTNKFLEAEELIQTILNSQERSPRAKFDTILQSEQLFVRASPKPLTGFMKPEFDLWQAKMLKKFSEEINDGKLKKFAKGYEIIAQLHYLVVQDLQLYLNWTQHDKALKQNPNDGFLGSFWYELLPLERGKIVRDIFDKTDQISNLLDEILSEQSWQYFPELATRTLWCISIFLKRLIEEDLKELAKKVDDWLNKLLDFTIEIASKLKAKDQSDATIYKVIVIHEILLTTSKDITDVKLQKYNEIKNLVEKINDEEMRKNVSSELDSIMKEAQNQQAMPQIPPKIDWENLENYYRNQAQALGINLELVNQELMDDPTNPRYTEALMAWIINLGIKDLNPTRVLKTCSYLIYEYWGGIGVPAQMVGLHSARMKRISCMKHIKHGSIAAYALDDVYSFFKERYCDNCPDIKPRPDTWEYSFEWHEEQVNQLKKSQQKYRKKKK